LISLLKEIYNTKLILIKCISNDINKKKYFSELYENSLKKISLNQYTETISGTHLEDFFL
jgi:predicted metallo-beta-lactamase superfamily hydrolase